MSQKKQILIFAIIVAILGVFFWPVKVICGAPHFTCTMEPINGVITRPYDVEPYGVSLLEGFLMKDLPFKYSEGYEDEVVSR